MRYRVLCASIAVLASTACSAKNSEVPTDAYSKAVYDSGIDFETKRRNVSKEHLLKLSEPVLFRLKSRSCVLFRPRPDFTGRQSVVCFDDQTREVVESFSP